MTTSQVATEPWRPTIVALNGSERAGGNTAQVLTHVTHVAHELGAGVDVVDLRRHTIGDCAACGDCNTRAVPCVVDDDVAAVVRRMRAADGVIYACPVHGYGMSSIMQRFVERAGVGYLRFERPLTNKVGGVIVTGRRYGHTDVHAQLVHNVLLNRMILVGSGYPAVVHGGAPGEAMTDVEGLAAVTHMVTRMVQMILLLRRHLAVTGESLPQPAGTERSALRL
ncbi:MAG: flavodoxin family protein [Angustibacter sp.]